MKRGFTLVEFLIVIGILSLSIGSILLILTTVIKGANQTNIIGEVKQNGQNVVDTLSGQIRNATDVYALNGDVVLGNQVKGPDEAESGIWVWTLTGEKLTIICVDAETPTPINNGKIMVATAPAITTRAEIDYSKFKPISNTDTVSGVDIVCGSTLPTLKAFEVSASTASSKVVFVNFVAKQAIGAPSRVDYNASAQFKTSISIRKYQ